VSRQAVLLNALARRAAVREVPLRADYINSGPSLCPAATAAVISAFSAALRATTGTKGELNG
jgi:hypothetical protein